MVVSWTHDPSPPKPHVHPLVSPNGRTLTRSETPDHPWQRGLWFSVKFVDDVNFWEEIEPFGSQRHRDDRTIEWVRPDGHVAVVEDRRIETVDDRTLDWTTTIEATTDVVLDRTPFQGWGGYSGLAFRGAGDWHDTRIATGEGDGPTITGDRAPWCDLSGPDAGVTIHDHPDNPRHPTPWYGDVANALYDTDEPTNFLNAAFLFHEPMPLAQGAPLRFRFRVRTHDGLGSWQPTTADADWEAFARA